MLTQEQLNKLNQAIRDECDVENPLAKLMKAAQQADIAFQDVLEHLIVQAVEHAQQSLTGPHEHAPNPS